MSNEKTIKMTLSELKKLVAENVNFWSHEYKYDPKRDSVDFLVDAALTYFSFEKNALGVESPDDIKFLEKIEGKLKTRQVDDKKIDQVFDRLRSIAPSYKDR